ncbi:MAG: NUDIX hydrolase N-terminal domain-containing protein [Acidimicrobiales bacterium]
MNDLPGEADLLRWSEALAGVARTGLGFTTNRFEAERYEEILAIAADIRAAAHHDPEQEERIDHVSRTTDEWMRMVGSGVAGYVTPKVAIGAVVGDDDGRLLLIQRADSGVWLYPTGWADIGYSPSEVAVKEVREETGIRCQVVRPLAIIDGMRAGFSRIPLYSIVFHCRAVGGELAAHPHETLDVGWFGRDELPSPLASGDQWRDLAFRAIDGEVDELLFDPPRNDIWRAPPPRR